MAWQGWRHDRVLEELAGQETTQKQLYTWTSPDGQHRNQIDYILCSQRWRSSIQSPKTRPGVDYGLDHELPIAKLDLN